MERYNPFAARSLADEPDPFMTGPLPGAAAAAAAVSQARPAKAPTKTGRDTTSFPDPLGDLDDDPEPPPPPPDHRKEPVRAAGPQAAARSNSVTFAPSHSVAPSAMDEPGPATPTHTRRPAGGGLGSFLTRATSVTSSTVTDRVSEAVGSMRSAVDSISSQLPTVESLSSTAGNLMGAFGVSEAGSAAAAAATGAPSTASGQLADREQQSAAAYLASKFSSATGQSPGPLPVISRQRVILVLDEPSSTQWAHQFSLYRRLTTGGAQSALTSFFSSATSSPGVGGTASSSSSTSDGADCLVEQADFREVSVLANQSTATATVLVQQSHQLAQLGRQSSGGGGGGGGGVAGGSSNSPGAGRSSTRIIRPEYVVVKQRTKDPDQQAHLRSIVKALNYSLVPMLEPIEIWSIFQDRQLLFAKLLQIQRLLGKENFPLIPQVYCQTHQCLQNYLNSSAQVPIPCLVRTGATGRAKIKADNMQMLKAFASIVATQDICCTLEPFLEVKYDLVVQKLGTSLKLFKRVPGMGNLAEGQGGSEQFVRQPASRQTSIGSSVLSSLISTSSQQLGRRSSSSLESPAFEKMAEVNSRYRNWVEAISRQFDNKVEAFSLKIVVTTGDREYIVGLSDCSMDFIGSQEHQDEDRRSFVELIISNMNTVLPKTSHGLEQASRGLANGEAIRRLSSVDDKRQLESNLASGGNKPPLDSALKDKKKFISQTQINGQSAGSGGGRGPAYGQLSSRSQSVSVNQLDQVEQQQSNRLSSFFTRRGSDNASKPDLSVDDNSESLSSQQQTPLQASSLSQSLFDQTTTAFSSFQKQSMSFFRRLDSRADDTNTPPLSAKSEQTMFDHQHRGQASASGSLESKRNGFKSQSVDCSGPSDDLATNSATRASRSRPPKPPPPTRPPLVTSYSTKRASSDVTSRNPAPMNSRQASGETDVPSTTNTARVVRQNSALSAFEPYDPDVAMQLRGQKQQDSATTTNQQQQVASGDTTIQPAATVKPSKAYDATKRSSNFDSASITSGDSNSTSNETTTAEDTMNNLTKTFASIFGDKCE